MNARRRSVANEREQKSECRDRRNAIRERLLLTRNQFGGSVLACSSPRGVDGLTGWRFGERMGPVSSKSWAAAAEGRDVPMASAVGRTRSCRFRLREKSTEPDAATSCVAPVRRSRWKMIFPLPHANTALAAGNELTPGCGPASLMDSSRLMYCNLASAMRALPRHSNDETRSARVLPPESSANSPEAEPANKSASVGNAAVRAARSTRE